MNWVADSMVFLIPIVGAVALFAFLAVASWAGSRQKEREAYYQYEFRKRLVDAGKFDGEDVKALVQFEHDSFLARGRQGMQAGGVTLVGVGVGLLFGLRFIEDEAVWMVGYIPLFLGLALLMYGLLFAREVPTRPEVARRPDRPID